MKSEKKLLKYVLFVALGTGSILLIPFIAMQFTHEVAWTLSDFIFAGILLFGTGSAFALTITRKNNGAFKAGMGLAIFTSFLMVWVNGAVGIVGHEGEAINQLYFGVVAAGLIGSFISRFKPQGMYYTMLFIVSSILVITVIAVMGFLQEPPHNSTVQILGVNAFFAVLYFLSAISFKNNFMQTQRMKKSL